MLAFIYWPGADRAGSRPSEPLPNFPKHRWF